MLSFRALARSASRTARLGSAASSRQYLRHAINPSPFRLTLSQVSRSAAAFSTTRTRFESDGTVNEELAVKLQSEMNIEHEMRDPNDYPLDVKEYLDNSPFEIRDTPGQDEVVLTRVFGDENIRISFSIEDLNQMDPDQEGPMPDESMMDELDDPNDIPESIQGSRSRSKGNINQAHAGDGNIKTAPEDQIATSEVEEEGMDEQDQEPTFPAHLYVTIERQGKGALQIEAIAQDGLFGIENVSYFKDAKLADATSADQEFKTRDLYTGPPFANLDEDLQVLFERYLDERGINVALATFVPNYIDYKEQREYTNWLSNVKSFVE